MSKKIFFIISIIVIIAGFLGFWFYRDRIFSKEILRLEILGPETAKMGEEIQYTIKYKNNGNFVLENPRLVFELPQNSLTEDSKTRLTQDLKDIYPGDEHFVQFSARLLGKEGDIKTAHAWLTYVPKNLSVRYEGETTFTTKIETVPLTLTFDLPSKVEKGKEVSYAVNYFSNIDYPLENLSIKIDPMSGFSFKSSDPTSLDETEWKLATLEKGQGGRININGIVIADTASYISFLAKLGMWVDGNFIVIKEATQDVEVISPLISISQEINGSTEYAASPGENLHYEIFFKNVGTTPFDNVFATSKLDGFAFDMSTLKSSSGQVRQSDRSVAWDAKQISGLQHLLPNQEVKVEFEVRLKDSFTAPDSEKNNVLIKNEVKVGDTTQIFQAKVSAKLSLSQKAYYASQQGIENSGPIPPQVNTTTTYTIFWQIKNDLNDVQNIKVKAVLPLGVTLSDAIVPESQASNFSLDSQSRQIVWSPGNLSPSSSISLAFQIALTPSILQKGNTVDLIGSATVSGEDQVTGRTVKVTVSGVNTSLSDDSENSGGGVVQ